MIKAGAHGGIFMPIDGNFDVCTPVSFGQVCCCRFGVHGLLVPLTIVAVAVGVSVANAFWFC